MSRIYVASSWRNGQQQDVVAALRLAGHEVYDFHNPAPDNHGFHWSDIDPGWQGWEPEAFRAALDHPVARSGFDFDWRAMQWADTGLLVLPCGRSAHLELGYFVGARKRAIVLLAPGEPELMYRMCGTANICLSIPEVVMVLKDEVAR